jgi:hypothetical protein
MSLSRRAFVIATAPIAFLASCAAKLGAGEGGPEGLADPTRTNVRSARAVAQLYVPSATTKVPLTPPGTAMVLFARRGDTLLTEALERAKNGSESELTARLLTEITSRPQIPIEQAKTTRDRAPVVASLEYGRGPDTTLLSDVFVPAGQRFGILYLTYSGAPFDPTLFSLTERWNPTTDDGIECVVLVRPPLDLTAAEAAAVAMVHPEQRELVLGGAGRKPECLAAFAVGFVVGVVAYKISCYKLVGVSQELTLRHLSADEIRTLGPDRSVRSLLDLRERALNH